MPDTVVIGRLSYYGRVLSFRRDVGVATGILNGVRTARMRLSRAIPSSVRIVGESVFVSYPGQPKTCCRCGEEGHIAMGCKKPCCYNCETPGHVASDCDLDPLCGVCLESAHHASDCPYLILSANVQPVVNSTPSYTDVARQNRPASPAAPPPANQQQLKRKADREQSRSVTPVHDREGERGKVRRCETELSGNCEENREEHRHRDRDREESGDERHPRRREEHHQDQESEQESGHCHHREERREDRRRERDCERESERDRRREGHHSRERSGRDRRGNHDRRRIPDCRPRRDHSPELFSSDSEDDDRYRDRRHSRY